MLHLKLKLLTMNGTFLPPKEGVVLLFFPKPEVKNSHTPHEAAGRGWSMGTVHRGFGKEY